MSDTLIINLTIIISGLLIIGLSKLMNDKYVGH